MSKAFHRRNFIRNVRMFKTARKYTDAKHTHTHTHQRKTRMQRRGPSCPGTPHSLPSHPSRRPQIKTHMCTIMRQAGDRKRTGETRTHTHATYNETGMCDHRYLSRLRSSSSHHHVKSRSSKFSFTNIIITWHQHHHITSLPHHGHQLSPSPHRNRIVSNHNKTNA